MYQGDVVPTYEYRRFSRVPAAVPVSFGADGSVFEGKTQNASACGMCIAEDMAVPLDTPCTVACDLGGGKEIEFKGTVVRIEAGILGIEITSVKDGGMPHLRELIRAHSGDPVELDIEMVSRASLLPGTY